MKSKEDLDITYKPNPEKIKEILVNYPPNKVKFILDFISIVIDRLKDGTLTLYNWVGIANDLGILKEVDSILDSFDIPEDEFYERYGGSLLL